MEMGGLASASERRDTLPPALAVSKRFGRFKDEDEKAVRAPDVVEDQTLRQLREAWLSARWGIDTSTEAKNYARALDAIKGIGCSSADVEKFVVALVEFQDEDNFRYKAGFFISALINNCKDNDFVINVRHLTKKIGYLGYQNTKNITVSGDVGVQLGRNMECGSITVEGNADIIVGESMKGGSIFVKGSAAAVGAGMKNGRITVEGDVELGLGSNMTGGTIEVKGNAGQWMGTGMLGGEIHIEGECESLPDRIAGGKIYHKGKLIYPKGEGNDVC
jgi:hypothetical protein